MCNQPEKMAVSPEKCTKKFRIPLYQRPYSWTTQQVSQLLKDLEEAFKKNTDQDYYLGILSIAPTESDSNRYDLIDGQQRITTLMLMAKVLANGHDKWKDFMADRLDLYGREEDKHFLYGSGETSFPAANTKMREAVSLIKAYVGAIKDGARFSKYVYEHACFFLSEVPKGYTILEKNQQFVRMNNRGKQLEPHEILKVKLLGNKDANIFMSEWDKFSQLGCESEQNKVSNGGSDEKMALADILKSNSSDIKLPSESEVFYQPIVDFPTFLLIALTRFIALPSVDQKPLVKTPVSFDKSKLLESFGFGADAVAWNGEQIEQFMKLLKSQYEALKSCFIYRAASGGYKFLEKESKWNTEDVKKHDELDKGRRNLLMVQSFLYVSTEPQHWMLKAFEWLNPDPKDSASKLVDPNEFAAAIEGIDKAALEIRSLRPAPSNLDLGGLAYDKQPSHYWFYRLDYELWKKWKGNNDLWNNLADEKARSLVEKYYFRSCNSIEHIIPQTNMGSGDNQTNNAFGNLALISREMNSRFSNNYEDGKREYILDSGYAESLKMVHFLWGGVSQGMNLSETMFKILSEAVQRGD